MCSRGGRLDVDEVARLAGAKVLLPDWYDDWVVIERERLRQLCLHALEQLSADAREQGRYAQATEAGLGAVALEPLRESAHRAVIEAYLAEDNASEALHHYRLFERMLDTKLGLRPSPRLHELVRVSDGPVTRRRGHRRQRGRVGEPTGVIVIRVWREPDHPSQLRARIVAVRNVAENDVENAAASSLEEIVELVERFVASFTAE